MIARLLALPGAPWAILGLLLAVFSSGAYVGHRWGEIAAQRARNEALEAALTRADGAIRERDRLAGIDARIGARLDAFAAGQERQAQDFRAAVAAAKLTREVKYVDPSTGHVDTCRERDAVAYQRLYNAAVTGVPADPATAAPGGVPQ